MTRFAKRGDIMTKRRSVFRNLSLAFVIAIGVGLVWGVVVGLTTETIRGLFSPERSHESIVVSRDGTPLIQSYRSGDYYDRTFRTLDGTVIEPERDEWYGGAYLYSPCPRQAHRHGDWMERIKGASDGKTPPSYWYFVHDGLDGGTGYFVGFDKKTKHRVGYLGRSGFQKSAPRDAERFPVRWASGPPSTGFQSSWGYQPRDYVSYGERGAWSQWIIRMVSGEHFCEINLRTLAIRAILTAPDLVAVQEGFSWARGPDTKDGPLLGNEAFLAARRSDRVEVLRPDKSYLRSYLLPEELKNSKSIQFYELEPDHALAIGMTSDSERGIQNAALRWIDPSGKILKQEDVQLVSGAPSNPFVTSTVLTLIVPVPTIATTMAVLVEPWNHLRMGRKQTYSAALLSSLSNFSLGLPAVFVVSAFLAWRCYRRQVRYAGDGQWAWPVFILLFGIPAYGAHLFHRRWPPLLPCPDCNDSVPRDRDTCAKCGHTFPEPELKGIEVFA